MTGEEQFGRAYVVSVRQADEAAALYRRAARLAMEGGEIRLTGMIEQNLGVLSNIRGDLDGALVLYRAALRAFQEVSDDEAVSWVLNNMGMLLTDLGLPLRAERSFHQGLAIAELRRAVYLDPYADEPHLLLGIVYQRTGRVAEAIDEFRVALWARETAEGQVALGRALLETGDRDAARAAAMRALELDPQSVDARELLDRIGG